MTDVVMIGSGNVAWSLAHAIATLPGYRLGQVYSPTLAHARELATSLDTPEGTDFTDRIDGITTNAHIYIISIKDDAIAPFVEAMLASEVKASVRLAPPSCPPNTNSPLWLHTSGGVEASALSPLGSDFGVLYPLQTFTRGREIDMKEVPLFIEGSGTEALASIKALASALSDNVAEADSHRRRMMHIAGVFGCNFTNYLWGIAEEVLRDNGMSLDTLRPLIFETLDKAMTLSPAVGQTGPARRNDSRVMEAHLAELSGSKAELYRYLSRLITDKYNEPNKL